MREQYLTIIEEIIYDFKFIFELLKLPEFVIPSKIDRVPSEYIEEAYKWIIKIHQKLYREFKRIKFLCKDSVWREYYADYDSVKTLREVKIMDEILRQLRLELNGKNKPIFFRRKEITRIINRKHKGLIG